MEIWIRHQQTSQVNYTEDNAFASALLPDIWDAYRYYDQNAVPPVLEPGHTIPNRGVKSGGLAVLSDLGNYLDNNAAYHPIVALLLEVDFVGNTGFHELWNTLEAGETGAAAGRSPTDVSTDVAVGIAAVIYEQLGLAN